MIGHERAKYILERLRADGIVTVKDVAAHIGISEVTIRRDFEKLEQEGKLKRVMGGATINGDSEDSDAGAELAMGGKVAINPEGKKKVAEFAAALVHDGDCVFIDGGTTMAPLAKILAVRKIKIVTYSLLALRMMSNAAADIFVIGGRFMPHYDLMVGNVSQSELRQYNFDIAFLGCSGIDTSSGMSYVTETETMQLKQIALEESKHSFLLADATKYHQRGFLRFEALSRFEKVISDHIPEGVTPPENLYRQDLGI